MRKWRGLLSQALWFWKKNRMGFLCRHCLLKAKQGISLQLKSHSDLCTITFKTTMFSYKRDDLSLLPQTWVLDSIQVNEAFTFSLNNELQCVGWIWIFNICSERRWLNFICQCESVYGKENDSEPAPKQTMGGIHLCFHFICHSRRKYWK